MVHSVSTDRSWTRNNRKFKLMAAVTISVVTTIAVIILLVVFLSGNGSQNAVKAAVVTNGYGCSDIGVRILEKGGNAVDAAIASLFCDGVSMPMYMGLGGGFLLTIYNKSTGEIRSLNAREVAPGLATEDMYAGDPKASSAGGLAVAVPGELIGYWELYRKFGGGVPWRDLVQPTIDLCRQGVYVTRFLAEKFQGSKNNLYTDPVLREIFFDPSTNDTYKEGQRVKRLRLARTLEIVAEEGGTALHDGSLTNAFVDDIKKHGGIITVDDMKNYKPEWREPVQATFSGGETLYSAPLPGSGVVLTFMLNILDGFLDPHEPRTIDNYQRIIESLKFGYGERTRLGDENFLPSVSKVVANLTSTEYAEEIRNYIFDNRTFNDPSYYGAITAEPQDFGTAHLSILAANGDAVSVTSTINTYFGAKFASNSTGIILNNEMDDFSSVNITNAFNLPPSPANFIVPGKRPLSSMCPTIVLDENKNVILIVGAAGGSRITTTVAQIIVNHLWYGSDLKAAMDEARIHHQLFPMSVYLEQEFNDENPGVVEKLQQIGHDIIISGPADGFAAATAISNFPGDSIVGMFDKRRPGSVSYLH